METSLKIVVTFKLWALIHLLDIVTFNSFAQQEKVQPKQQQLWQKMRDLSWIPSIKQGYWYWNSYVSIEM